MRALLVLTVAAAAGCAESLLAPTFPQRAAGQPVVQEQALLGLSRSGAAAVAELIDAEGQPPQLRLFAFADASSPAKLLAAAPEEVARAVADELRARGQQAVPLLAGAVAARWPQALQAASKAGLPEWAPSVPEPGRSRFAVPGQLVPLQLRVAEMDSPGRAVALLLGERPGGLPGGDEVELSRQPLAGRAVEPQLWVRERTAWLLAGSTDGGGRAGPLRRTVGLRRGDLRRGEAELHNVHGLADYAAGDLDAARREFARALAIDGGFFDALYNGAAVAALSDRADEAIELLYRAAKADPRRIQVIGRNDEDLRQLRRRAEVRGLLGLKRPSPADLDPQR